MKNLISINYIYFIVLILTLQSCVGTIQSSDPVNTKSSTTSSSLIDGFQGINQAIPISNSKIDLFFTPVSGNVDNFTYIISYDNQQIPVYAAANSLKVDYRGFAKYTVTGLDSNKKYTFQVQVRDVISKLESSNAAKLSATTFANPTANFYGVSEVRNLSGSAGLNGIEVVWPEAETKGTDVFKNDIDPIEYRITIVDSTFLNPGNINDTTFTDPIRKVVSANGNQRNLIINGLKSGTKYYVQVRAIHYAYTANAANSSYKTEENTNYLQITTYTDDLGNLSFKNSSFYLSWPSGNAGLYAINANWEAPTGNFDHYRIYYAQNGTANISSYLASQDVDALCLGSEVNNTNVFCEEADSDKINSAITGLSPNTTYNFILAVCLTNGCERSKRVLSSSLSKATTPNIASFQGITTINTSSDITNLNTLKLNFNLPDFNSGNISGYLVDFYGTNPNSTTPVTLNDSGSINSTVLSVDDFDYATATSVTVRGVDYTTTDQQCFLVYPFTYNSTGIKTTSKSGLTPVCVTPLLTGPKQSEFPGFTSNNALCDKDLKKVELRWDAPTKGIFDKYEIFYIKSDTSSFSFGDALLWESNPNYHRILVDGSNVSYTLSDMATGAGAVYKIGIITFYDSPNGSVRSEFNTNTVTCDFR